MTYAVTVNLEELSPYVFSRLQELQYGQKGQLAKQLGVSLAQLSHFISGTKPIPQKYVPGILGFFQERINLQIVSTTSGQIVRE